jgi:hypothetical protein
MKGSGGFFPPDLLLLWMPKGSTRSSIKIQCLREGYILRRFLLLCLPLVVLFSFSSASHARELHDSLRIALYTADAEPGSSNSQPIALAPEQIAAALSRVRAHSGQTGKIIELFPKKNCEEASKLLAKVLRRTDSNQDLHLISFRKIGSFLASSRNATSARVFVENGRLNLIFGQIDLFHSEFRDPNLKSLPPMGSRKQAAALKGSILPAPGVTFVNGRKDWVALDLTKTLPPPSAMAPSANAPAAGVVSAPAPAEQPVKTLIRPPKRSFEERFRILKNLRDKGLITEQEYVDKKRDLLNSL